MSTQSVEETFRAAWEDAIASGPPARRIAGVRKVDFRSFVDDVYRADPSFVRDFVRSAYAGEAYIFTDAYAPAVLRALITSAHAWAKSQATQEPLLLDGVTDYRSRREWHAEEKGGYSSTYDMLHFYRWNSDPLHVFELMAEQSRLLHTISGFEEARVIGNKPSDGIVDRVEISHYPTGIGGIAFHSDPLAAQRFQMTVTLSEFGKDFKKGGFGCGGQNDEIVQLEPLAPPGSIFGFLPTICHGVEVIDPDLAIDWEGTTGRWYAAMSMVTSSAVKNREMTRPVGGFPTLREQIARHQRQAP